MDLNVIQTHSTYHHIEIYRSLGCLGLLMILNSLFSCIASLRSSLLKSGLSKSLCSIRKIFFVCKGCISFLPLIINTLVRLLLLGAGFITRFLILSLGCKLLNSIICTSLCSNLLFISNFKGYFLTVLTLLKLFPLLLITFAGFCHQ